jgi:tRNA-dihydrouridine synthase B
MQRYQVIRRHLEGLYQLYGEHQGVRIARKHLGWYAQHLPQGDDLRKRFNRAQSAEHQCELIQQFFEPNE